MSKNLSHLTNIHEAALNLRASMLPYKWFIDVAVLERRSDSKIIADKSDKREIVVYVDDEKHLQDPIVYKSWPLRYEIGVKRN